MKLGIITVHNSPNYGACLQSYGLYHYLCSIGYECEIIDLHRPTHSDYVKSKVYTLARNNKKKKKSLLKKILGLFLHKKKKLMTTKAKSSFDRFNSRIKLSRPYRGIDALYDNPPSYDVYISGSDQLWNPTIGFCNEPYFLTFVKKGGKRISYATSIGIEDLLEHEKMNYAQWLKSYQHISVREKSAKQLLEQFVDQPIDQVADPSFLPERSHWQTLAVKPNVSKPFILLFTLSYNAALLQMARRFASESNKKLIYLCLKQPDVIGDYICEKDAGPEEWLGYLADADMVLTDSFHGTVFSIIMGPKNFFSYVPTTQKRGKRITDLLDTFGLSNHVFSEYDLNVSFDIFEKMELDHEKISGKYLTEQKRSRNYLIEAVNN